MAVSAFVQLGISTEPSAPRTGVPVQEIRAIVAKYTANIPTPRRVTAAPSNSNRVVLLTGSTGNVGSHILAHLLCDARISRVYVLNRPSDDPLGRLKAAFSSRLLPTSILADNKLVFLVGDVSQVKFGLEEQQYDEVCILFSSVDNLPERIW